jgi:hypothetical protein
MIMGGVVTFFLQEKPLRKTKSGLLGINQGP